MPNEAENNLATNEALCEAVRVMFGFRSRDEVGELFQKPLVHRAIVNLETALEIVRSRRQPDEFALSLAVEMQMLKEASTAGHDLESLFNDPAHREPPAAEITDLMERLWR